MICGYKKIESKIIIDKSVPDLFEKIGIPKHSIRLCLRTDETKVKNGYAFRYKSDKEWDTNFVEYIKVKIKILTINILTGEKKNYSSLRQTSKELKLDRNAIKYSLINNTIFNGYLFKEIKNNTPISNSV